MNLSKYGLPTTVKYCQTCVISNQRPSSTVEFLSHHSDTKKTIYFDNDGICDACRFNERKNKYINWSQRENELYELSDKLSKHSGYNIIVPGSGGKDSAFTAHVLKYKYGFRPLTVTWAPHLYTDIGRSNFESWINVGGLDNILYTPNGILHRHLTKLAFHNLLHPFQPFIIGQKLIGPSLALKFGIPVVFYGENQAEYGNTSSENNSPIMDSKFFALTNLDKLKFGGLSISEIINQTKFSIGDFEPYLPPPEKSVYDSNIQVHYLGYYLKWDPQECFYYASENTGFKSSITRTEGSYSKYSSLDDKIDPFHYYTTLIKFGLGRASYDASQEIRNKKITRIEGISLVRKFDTEFPHKYFNDFLDYIDTKEAAFHKTIDDFRSEHLWLQSNSGWKLRTPIWDS